MGPKKDRIGFHRFPRMVEMMFNFYWVHKIPPEISPTFAPEISTVRPRRARRARRARLCMREVQNHHRSAMAMACSRRASCAETQLMVASGMVVMPPWLAKSTNEMELSPGTSSNYGGSIPPCLIVEG